jgi:hypothetical protein
MGVIAAGEVRALNGLLAAVYVGLHTGQPTSGNEIVGNAYARQAYVYALSGGDPTVANNSAIIQFPTATADWGTITHAGIWTASTVGTLLAWQALTASKFIGVDDVFRFLANKLQVTLD